jgi:Tfp pilus assembly protein PilF
VWARADRRIAFAALLVLAGVAPVANVIPAPFLQADRYTHLPLVGVAYVVVAAAAGIGHRLRAHPAVVAGALAIWISVVLAPATWARTGVWRNGCTLWGDTVARSPEFPHARNNLGVCFLREGDLERAEQEFSAALRLSAGFADPWSNLGLLRSRQGRLGEAREAFERALALAPEHPETHTNLALTYHELGEPSRAESHLRRAIALAPRNPEPYAALGFLLGEQHRPEEAAEWLERGLEIHESATLHNNLAWVLLQSHRLEEALAHARRAVELGPELATAWDTLGVALARAGHTEEARRSLERALALNPRLELARHHLEQELGGAAPPSP